MKHPFVRYIAVCAMVASAAWLYTPAPLGAQPASADSAGESAPGFEPHAPSGDRRDADLPFLKPLNEEEMEQSLTFAREKMPFFYDLWTRMPPARQRRLPPRMQMGFRLMLDAKNNDDPRLYDVLSEQMMLRDEFIGLRREHRQSGFAEETKQALKANVRQMIDLGIKQRELRIEKMERMIEAEKTKLAHDRSNPESLIESQFRRLEEETSRFVGFARRFQPPASMPTQPATQPADSRN